MSTATAPRTRKPRGPGRLSPQHLDYLRYRQAGKTQKDAAKAANVSIAKAKRAEKHPDGQRYLAEIAENARIAGHYELKDAVKEVDKAILFAYECEHPAAIAKLLEHKSKLYGLLVEKIDVKTTYIDLKGALEQAKERVLVQLNPMNRGIVVPQSAPAITQECYQKVTLTAPQPDPLPILTASQSDASTSMDSLNDGSCLHRNSPSSGDIMQADIHDLNETNDL